MPNGQPCETEHFSTSLQNYDWHTAQIATTPALNTLFISNELLQRLRSRHLPLHLRLLQRQQCGANPLLH